MKRLSDTTPEAEKVLTEAFRAMTPARKWQLLEQSQRMARVLHEAGVKLRDPNATPRDVHRSWNPAVIGESMAADDSGDDRMLAPIENLQVVRDVAGVFASLGIAYALGGSLASSVYGAPGYTLDGDMTAEPFPGKEA